MNGNCSLKRKRKKERNQRYYREYKEKINKHHKKYRKKHKKEFAKRDKKYREKNKEKITEYQKKYGEKYRGTHKEEIAKRQREWWQKNGKEQRKKHNKRRCASVKNRNFLKKTQGTGVTCKQWDEILRKYNYCCAYCGIQGNMTVDHVIPILKGGEHSPDNVVPACIECNVKKGVRKDWKPKKFRLRKRG